MLRTPLQKVITGGFLAAIAFTISGCLELELEKTYPVKLGKNEMVISAYNGIKARLKN